MRPNPSKNVIGVDFWPNLDHINIWKKKKKIDIFLELIHFFEKWWNVWKSYGHKKCTNLHEPCTGAQKSKKSKIAKNHQKHT